MVTLRPLSFICAARIVNSHAASSSVAMVASLNWMAWNSLIGFAELAALLGVAHRGVECAACYSEGERGDGDAATVEDSHCVFEAFAEFADEVFGGNLAVFEDEFGGITGAEA